MTAAFADWPMPPSKLERLLREHQSGKRTVLVAPAQETISGFVTVLWVSGYPPFATAGVPEINDFSVLADYRRRGTGTALMDAAESLVAEQGDTVGIGVGLYDGYGAAQRMYVKRGYIPDGQGISVDGRPVQGGETVLIDDVPALHFTKRLR